MGSFLRSSLMVQGPFEPAYPLGGLCTSQTTSAMLLQTLQSGLCCLAGTISSPFSWFPWADCSWHARCISCSWGQSLRCQCKQLCAKTQSYTFGATHMTFAVGVPGSGGGFSAEEQAPCHASDEVAVPGDHPGQSGTLCPAHHLR